MPFHYILAMKKQPVLFLSKLFASINIFIAIAVLYVCYLKLSEYYETLLPKDLVSPNLLQTVITLIVYAILSIAACTIFIFNKKTGWWFLIVLTIILAIRSVYVVIETLINTPGHHNLDTQILLAVFYVLSTIIYLSKQVRVRYGIMKPTLTE